MPVFCDSQSTVFVARSATAIRKAVWAARRASVLREAVDAGVVVFIKIDERNNVADSLTKPVKRATLAHHMSYVNPQAHGDFGAVKPTLNNMLITNLFNVRPSSSPLISYSLPRQSSQLIPHQQEGVWKAASDDEDVAMH